MVIIIGEVEATKIREFIEIQIRKVKDKYMSDTNIEKDNLLFIVTGKSGVGKTTFINRLLNIGFSRPISFTTRAKRNDSDNEYIHVSEELIMQLYKRGDIINLDLCYGNYYGMSKKSIEEIFLKGKYPIKEIRYDNIKKLKDLYTCITILIKGEAERGERDDEVYDSLDESTFDIILYREDLNIMIDKFWDRVYNKYKIRVRKE